MSESLCGCIVAKSDWIGWVLALGLGICIPMYVWYVWQREWD